MDDVNRLEEAIGTATTCMNQLQKVDTAIFVGNTKSGKSSLINYLIGNKLVGVKVDPYRPVTINKADDAPGPKIGLGYTSETIIPTKWSSPKLPGLTIWDVPGFDDNRGPIQDIVNSFYINGLFKNVASAKIVVVVDINDLTNDNIRPLLNVLKAVENLLTENMKDCLGSVAMILTKVPDFLNETKVDKNIVCEILQNQLLSSSEIDVSEVVRDLVQQLLAHNQKIGFFKRPDIGEVTDVIVDDGIISAINSAQNINTSVLQRIRPSVAEATKVFLYEVREKLTYNQNLMNLQNMIDAVINRRMAHFESMQHAGTSRDQLVNLNQELSVLKNNILQCIDSPMVLELKLESCKVIDVTVQNFICQSNLREMSKFILFTDYILNVNAGQSWMNYIQNSLNNGLTRIDRLLSWIPSQFEAIARREAEEQAARERARQEEEMRQLQARIEEERRVQAQLQEQQRQAEALRLQEEQRMREARRKKRRWYRF